MEIKKQEVVQLHEDLTKLLKLEFSFKLAYCISRNHKILSSVLSTIEDERIILCKTYAKKDSNLEPLIENGEFVFEENVKQEFIDQLVKLMNETVEVNFFKLSELPEDKIPTSVVYKLLDKIIE